MSNQSKLSPAEPSGAAAGRSPDESNAAVQPLPWSDDPLPALIRLAWPIVISMLSMSAMTLADTLMVSTLGSWALAGVGLGGVVSFILSCFPMGALGGIRILASQAIGSGRPERALPILGAGLLLAVVMAAFSLTAALAVTGLFPLVTATPETAAAASVYLWIVAFGALPLLVRIAIEQSRLASGDSRSPMRVNVFANICNVALNYLFIFVLEMGVQGAAFATLIASVIGCAAMIYVQFDDGYQLRGVTRQQVAGVWRLGYPAGLQMALEMGTYATMVVMLTNLSDLDGAANQIAIQVLHFGFLPCVAIGQAAAVLAGQAVGAGRRSLVQVIAIRAMIPTGGYALLAAAVFFFFGGWIADWFTDDPELRALATRLLIVAAVFQLADAVNIISRSVLQGTGDVRFCAWIGISVAWLVTPPLTWLLGYRAGLGAFGGWIGLCCEIFVTTAIFWTRVRGTRWHAAADRSIATL